MVGKCPKCEKLVNRVNLNEIDASSFMGTAWRTITYNCPYCSTVLGCQIDPIAIKADTVDDILESLKKK